MEGCAVDIDEEQAEGKGTGEKVDCSHRVIEKRRRDRINNSLLQLSKLVPVEKLNKKNSGKLEKAEILEVTVNYLIQQQFRQDHETSAQNVTASGTSGENEADKNKQDQLCVFLQGFKQCITEATNFFQDIEELDISEGRCHRLIQHLKRQVTRYDRKNEDISRIAMEDHRVWDHQDKDSNQAKRKNGDIDGTPCKKPRTSYESNGEGQRPGETSCSSGGSTPSSSNSDTQGNFDQNSQRNYMPFIFPNMPMFTTLPFAGANNMPRFQATQSQFPGYQYQQSTPQYIPIAMPQFPMMGMNFMPGFGMVNGEQAQSGGANALPVHSGVPNNAMHGMMPTGMPNGFFPSMYSNGLHANIMAMRPRDSGYESSEKSSSSKASGSETSQNSMQSFSDDSCQSFVSSE